MRLYVSQEALLFHRIFDNIARSCIHSILYYAHPHPTAYTHNQNQYFLFPNHTNAQGTLLNHTPPPQQLNASKWLIRLHSKFSSLWHQKNKKKEKKKSITLPFMSTALNTESYYIHNSFLTQILLPFSSSRQIIQPAASL